MNTYEYASSDPLGYIDPTGEVPIAPIVWSYFRCVTSCTARSSIVDALTGEVDCWPNTLTDNAQDCALGCANPINWLGKNLLWAKGGRQRVRDTGLEGMTDEEIQDRINDPKIDPKEKRRLQKEQKGRGVRNKQKRRK